MLEPLAAVVRRHRSALLPFNKKMPTFVLKTFRDYPEFEQPAADAGPGNRPEAACRVARRAHELDRRLRAAGRAGAPDGRQRLGTGGAIRLGSRGFRRSAGCPPALASVGRGRLEGGLALDRRGKEWSG